MSTLKMEREFPVGPDWAFAFVTQTEHLLKWWGHEGSVVTNHRLDFTRKGPWSSVPMTAEGSTHNISGTVTAVDPPHSVEFTWAWHDEKDVRGRNTTVRFEVNSNGSGGTIFTVIHSGLADEESVANHRMGWTSTLQKLERMAH